MSAKKALPLLLCITLALAAFWFFGTGFRKDADVLIQSYAVSPDGASIELTVDSASSVGHIRRIAVREEADGTLLLDCCSAFGGVNGSVGAKKVYVIPVSDGIRTVCLCRGDGQYEPVLTRDMGGAWRRITG